MTRRVVLIQHAIKERDDRASTHLAGLGYALDWRYPFQGESLGEPDGSVAATLIYGGGDPKDERDWHTDRYPFIAEETRWVEKCMAKGIPTIGFCLGGQMIAHALGARIGPHPEGIHEFGYYALEASEEGRGEIPDGLVVAQSHYHGLDLPAGARHLAASASFPNQAFSYGATTYGFQYHPEITIAGFRRWQDRDWAPWGKPGVQTRAEQDRLAAEHDAAQHAWLTGLLDRLVGRAEGAA
jgi:GMP synthase (glutamine-hydrolysing)